MPTIANTNAAGEAYSPTTVIVNPSTATQLSSIALWPPTAYVWAARHGSGWALVVDATRGSRPTFAAAAPPEVAEPVYVRF